MSFEELLQSFTDGLFGVLFITNKNSSHNASWHFLELFIDHMQDIAFPLAFELVPWQTEIHWLQTALGWFSPERLIGTSAVLYDLITTVVGLVLVNALWVGYSFSRNRFRFFWTLKILRGTLGLFATILYIPVLSFFVDNIVDCEDGNGPEICWTGPHVFKTIFSIIIMIIFIGLALAVKATFFEPDPKSKDISSRPHSRLDMFYLACRTVLTILAIVLQRVGAREDSLSHAKWIMTASCLATSSSLAFGYLWYMPFYNLKYSALRSGLMNNFLWASLCMLYSVLRPYSDAGIFFIIGVPIVGFVSVLLFNSRVQTVKDMPVSSIHDPLILELKARFKLMERGLLFIDGLNRPENGANGGPGASPNLVTTAQAGLGVMGVSQVNEAEKATLDEANEIYIQGQRQMPKSCMLQLFAGSFQLNHLNNRAQCLALNAKAAGMSPKLDEAFIIFRRQRLLNERFAGGDVIDFIAFEQNLQNARQNERKATIAVVQFWSELLKRHPSFYKLQSYGAAISQAVSLAQSHYITLIKLSPDTPQVFRLYGNFLINVLNDHKQGQELIDHADELEDEDERENIGDDDSLDIKSVASVSTNIDLFSDENGLITMSGEHANLGIILNANPTALRMFGYKRSELIGRKIEKIIPSPFAEMHDTFLRRYLQTGFAKVIDRSRQILGINNSNYLIPFMLHVKHMVDDKGKQTFIGVVKACRESPHSGFLILDEKFYMIHFAKVLGDFFGEPERSMEEIDRDDPSNRIHLSKWLPGAGVEKADEISSRKGLRFEKFKANGASFDLTLTGDLVVVGDTTCYLCRIKFFPAVEECEPQEEFSERRPSETISACPVFQGGSKRPSVALPPQALNDINESTEGLPFDFSPQSSLDNVSRNGGSSSSAVAGPPPSLSNGGTPPFPSKRRASITFSAFPPPAKVANQNSPHMSTTSTSDAGDGDAGSVDSPHITGSISRPRRSSAKSDDANSVNTRSSRATSSASYARRAMSLKNDWSNRRLLWLHLSFLFCNACLIGLAVYAIFDYRDIYATLNGSIRSTHERFDFAAKLVEAVDATRSIDFARAGGWWRTANSTLGLDNARAVVKANAQVLRSSAQLFSDFGVGKVQSVYFASPDGGSKALRPLDALTIMLSQLQDVAAADISDSGLEDKIALVISNGPFVTVEAINASAFVIHDLFDSYYGPKPVEALSKATIAPALCIIFIVVLILPLYVKLEDMREEFLRMFYDIPKEVVKAIYQSHYQRIVDDAEDDVDGTDMASRFELESVLAGSNSNLRSSAATGPKPSSSAVKPPPLGDDSLRRRIRNWFLDQHKVALKALAIFLITAVFFFTSAAITFAFLHASGETEDSVVWSSQRPILLRQSSYALREALAAAAVNSSSSSPSSSTTTAARPLAAAYPASRTTPTTALLSSLQWVDAGIVYGEAVMDRAVPLAAQALASQSVVLEFENACVDGVTPEDCAVFDRGLMARGLRAALADFAAAATALESEMDAARAAGAVTRDLVAQWDAKVAFLRLLALDYIFPSLNQFTAVYADAVNDRAIWFTGFHLIFAIIYIVLLIVIHLAVIQPLINSLSEDIKRTSALVYMLPSQIFGTVPSFRKWAEQNFDPETMAGLRRTGEGKIGEDATQKEGKLTGGGGGSPPAIMQSRPR
ncbi:hypothetical protein DFJ73DRAFT_962976 [Zopfochytrium polystomum]|nr:hypothetical protein DFJ73DRAFT_962976 [Zopfochytrium polystomum]